MCFAQHTRITIYFSIKSNYAFRRTKNLKDLLAPSKCKPSKGMQVQNAGCFKCQHRCDLCAKYFQETDHLESYVTGHKYACPLKSHLVVIQRTLII